MPGGDEADDRLDGVERADGSPWPRDAETLARGRGFEPPPSDLAPAAGGSIFSRSSVWTDLGLTLPIFVLYHLLVIFLPVRNAADLVTRELVQLADHSTLAYCALTLGVGALLIGVLLLLGRQQALRWQSFVVLALEGVLYAVAMRLSAVAVVGRLFLGGGANERFTGLVMSLGAGFYEELAFRVVLFGLGLRLLALLARPAGQLQRWLLATLWAVACAVVFSAWHHIGTLGEPFEARAFVFRAVCGLAFTLIYAVRGFAPVVWTHVLYDVWVLVL
jgi:hypothetical protein